MSKVMKMTTLDPELVESQIFVVFFFFQAEDGIRDLTVTGVQTCALPISYRRGRAAEAVRLLSRACAAEPNNPDAMHQFAGAYLLGGRIGPMRELLTPLVELDPLTASNHCLLGMSYLLGGGALFAPAAHQRAVELDPRSTICRVCAAIPPVVAGRGAERAS